MECLPTEAAYSEQGQTKTVIMWDVFSKNVKLGLHKPSGTHIIPPRVMDAGHGAKGFNVFPSGILFLPSGIICWKNVTCCLCIDFYRDSQLRICLESQRGL